MIRPICQTCPYWDSDAYDEIGGIELLGHCRRFPAAIDRTEGTETYDMDQVIWPTTCHLDWCGEHPDFPAYIASLKEEKDARDPRKTVKQRFEPPMGHRP